MNKYTADGLLQSAAAHHNKVLVLFTSEASKTSAFRTIAVRVHQVPDAAPPIVRSGSFRFPGGGSLTLGTYKALETFRGTQFDAVLACDLPDMRRMGSFPSDLTLFLGASDAVLEVDE